MKKHTYKEVKDYIESFGYSLLSEEYVSLKKNLKILCLKGHEYEATFNNFKNHNKRCPHCNGGVRLNYENVKEYIESFGQKLLDTEYKNAKTKLSVMCEHGHVYHPTFDSFKSQGSRCPHCQGKARYTYAQIKEYISSCGYKLISEDYKNKEEKLEVECDKGHRYYTTFGNFKNGGNRCPYCYGHMRFEYEYVKEYIESFGYELLSQEYNNCSERLDMRCDMGHEYSATFDKFRQGRRCHVCNGTQKHTYEYIKSHIEKHGYTLLSGGHEGTNSRIEIMCENGHYHKTKFYNFNILGGRCFKCRVSEKRHSYEYVKNYIENTGYKLLSKEYNGAKEKLDIMCDKGHEYSVGFDSFKNGGARCPVCYGTPKFEYKYVMEYIELFGYTLLSDEYVNGITKLDVMCDKGHKYRVRFSDFKNGNCRCPMCNVSKGEEKIREFLNSNRIKYDREHIFSDCRYKKPLPFDFYIPDLNICIEYDGEQHYIPYKYYGGERGLKFRQMKDGIKTKYCEDNNILLIRIPYWDFDNIEEILPKHLQLKCE